MKLNWNFLGQGGEQNKIPSVGGVRIFSGTRLYICKQSGELVWCKDGLGCIPGLCVIWIEFISEEEDSHSYLRNQTVGEKPKKKFRLEQDLNP